MRRTSIPVLSLVLVLSLPLAVHAAPGGGDGGSGPAPGPPPPPALTDRDGNGVSDDLQARLRDARPNDLVDVVATFETPRSAAWAKRQVGPFDVNREFEIIPGFAATMRAAQVRALAGSASVFRIDADFEVTTTNDAANRDFGATAARTTFGVDGSGVEVCVVDTGVDPNHEQFSSKLPIPFYDAINGRTTAYDDQGHGTHVAGTAVGDGTGSANAARHGGVAPGAALSAAKVLSASGSGTAEQVIAGIEWCAARPGDVVISMSLGSSSGSDGKDAISQAVNQAVNGGTPVVVAAGNSGDAPETVGSPGAAEGAITVAAVAEWSAPVGDASHSGGIHLAPWSSRGPTLDGRVKPDISAPGMTITSALYGTTDGYATYSGTSMATPYVSGAVALALEADRSLAPSDLKGLLRGTAHDRGPNGQDNDWGWGLLDVLALVDTAAGTPDQTTTFPVATHLATQSVADNAVWVHQFEVSADAMSVPIAATILIDGTYQCDLWFWGLCWSMTWTGADLDARLVSPDGTSLALSECPLGCHSTSIGRQETITAMPTTAGTYRLEIFPFSGSPNDGRGGTFTVDLSHGPVGGATEPPPPPATGSLAGTITDDASKEVIGGATVSILPSSATGTTTSTTTGTDGTYAFTDLEPDTYTVTASATGYQDAADSVGIVAGEAAVLDLRLTPDPPAAAIELSAVAYKVRGQQKVDLTWSGAGGTHVDVHRTNAEVRTITNESPWTDHINARGGGSYTYRVCEVGTSDTTNCSNDVTVTF